MKTLFNDGWEFSKQPAGHENDDPSMMSFSRVNLPHDWLIGQADDLYEDSVGFYRKRFSLKKEKGKRYELYFEGAYMDTTLFVNGKEAGEWKYGYSSFYFDVTDFLKDGENELVVRLVFKSPNSRWYSGAGLYRDVFFITENETHIVTDSVYVSAKPVNETELAGDWELFISAEVACGVADCLWDKGYKGSSDVDRDLKVTYKVPEAGIFENARISDVCREIYPDGTLRVEIKRTVSSPELWSLSTCHLYTASVSLDGDDEVTVRFGFRYFRFDNDHGLFVNGEHVKIRGVCEHHDLGAIGAVFNRSAMRRKFEILRGMGVNAIRTAHNMPAVGLLDLADEMGFLVLDEAFDMWEGSKTDFDYARFFREWNERDVRSWVRRDRNHPSVFMWSIGNEIYDTHKDEHGLEITKMLMDETRRNDPRSNAVISMGSNYMPWENTQKCADILKYIGYNYAERLYDEHHAAHPDWYIFGSETSSIVQSRGIYHFPFDKQLLADDDWQCSSLGNSTASWGAPNPEYCITQERDHEFSMGQFLWTGFDYIGEPTPYHTRNSYFGQTDTAGFPKDSYYIYKAGWTDYREDPFVHLFPYWDFNPGQIIDVRAVTNAPSVELFLNGKSLGRKNIDHEHGLSVSGDYRIPYEEGEITAVAYDDEGKEIARESRYSFGEAVKLVAKVYDEDRTLMSGCADMCFVEVSALDENGHPVENAGNIVSVDVSGAGYLTGLDNGDSTDTDEYKGREKRLFSGKMLVCIAVGENPGAINVSIDSEGLKGVKLTIPVSAGEKIPGISLMPEVLSAKAKVRPYVRKIELSCDGERKLTKDHSEVLVRANLCPAGESLSPDDLIWKAVNDTGIDSTIAKVVEVQGPVAKVQAFGDGNFRLRCMCRCGCKNVRVISELDFSVEGIGEATIDPYGFVSGGLWSYHEGDIGVGNEHGVSTQRGARSVVGFEHIDFGSYGSDEITISIFHLSSDPFDFELWDGIPEKEGSDLVLNGHYHKEMIWNEYQPETYTLKKRLKGLCNLYLVARDKAHIGGFSFKKLVKAYSVLNAGECDAVYGDKFTKLDDRIEGIGNNVTVEFKDMDFGEKAATSLTVTGRTDIPVNTIHVVFDNGSKEIRDILEFTRDGGKEQTFSVSGYKGTGTVRFVFLPGSSFDFERLRFF